MRHHRYYFTHSGSVTSITWLRVPASADKSGCKDGTCAILLRETFSRTKLVVHTTLKRSLTDTCNYWGCIEHALSYITPIKREDGMGGGTNRKSRYVHDFSLISSDRVSLDPGRFSASAVGSVETRAREVERGSPTPGWIRCPRRRTYNHTYNINMDRLTVVHSLDSNRLLIHFAVLKGGLL
jgi:hypothetical protein